MHLGPDVATPEEQIERLQARLAQAQKLSAVGELAGTITHEFNNVLMTIINYAKLGMRHRDDATRDKAFEKILSAGTRAARIAGSVLALARNRTTHLESTDVAQVIDDTLLLLERELNKYRVAVDRSIHPAPPAMANSGQVQQVLVNLLTNARQALPGGGRVVVKLAFDPASQTVDLTVRDNGCGIPADKLPRIFDSYFTTKSGPDASGVGGTGLGLSLCREIVEAHHGRIRVESTVGRGTAFTIKLPVDPASPLARMTEPAAASPRASGSGLPSRGVGLTFRTTVQSGRIACDGPGPQVASIGEPAVLLVLGDAFGVEPAALVLRGNSASCSLS